MKIWNHTIPAAVTRLWKRSFLHIFRLLNWGSNCRINWSPRSTPPIVWLYFSTTAGIEMSRPLPFVVCTNLLQIIFFIRIIDIAEKGEGAYLFVKRRRGESNLNTTCTYRGEPVVVRNETTLLSAQRIAMTPPRVFTRISPFWIGVVLKLEGIPFRVFMTVPVLWVPLSRRS